MTCVPLLQKFPLVSIRYLFEIERVIRAMLKMSFFNECLSSLSIQDSSALYSYTRCLEYYSRVQDFCLSLFSDVCLNDVLY